MTSRRAPDPLTRPARKSLIRTVTIAAPLVAALGLSWWAAAGPKAPPLVDLEAELPRQTALQASPSGLAAEARPAAIGRTVEVRRGDTLMALLVGAGADRQEAHKAITALKTVYSPRKLKPGQAVHLAFSADADTGGSPARLLSLRLQESPEREIQVARRDLEAGYVATKVDRPLTLKVAGRRGRIDSSLFAAGQDAEVPVPVMIDLIHAFSFNVDFQREIWPGDGFELLYESYYDRSGALAKTGNIVYAALILSGQRVELYRFTPANGRTDNFDATGQSVRKTLMRTPIDGARISSGYGRRRHPVLGYNKMHRGTDFAASRGTPVYAAGDGVIERAGPNRSYGNYIRIRHNSTYKTAYAHLRGYAKGIRRGRRVKQGQVIGYVGTTGRSTGPHLHYEVMINGKQVNPLRIKLPSGAKLNAEDLAAFRTARAEIERLREKVLPSPLLVRAQCGEESATQPTADC